MGPVCETCGDIGFEEALVFCDFCKIEAIHRYCIDITPTPFTEYITWICEDCDGSESESESESDKLKHILKKSDKKRKKSSNHTRVGLAEDHGLQDATSVEPVEGSSWPIKETVESNSGTDHNLGTCKRSDSSTNWKEVDQTDKLLNISKKNEKDKKKKKNSTMSRNPTPTVLAVEDPGVQDVTNVEPVKVSSSPIKETMKTSKKRASSDSGKLHELTGLVRNGVSSVPDHSSCTSKRNNSGKEVNQNANFGHILEKVEKKKKKNKKSSNHYPPVSFNFQFFVDQTKKRKKEKNINEDLL